MMMATCGFNGLSFSGDYVGDQEILDLADLVFEAKFHFFQALQLQGISRALVSQGFNCNIKVPVLVIEILQLAAQLNFLQLVHRRALTSC